MYNIKPREKNLSLLKFWKPLVDKSETNCVLIL